MHAPRDFNGLRRGAELLAEEAAEVASSDAEPAGDRLEAHVRRFAALDQAKSAGNPRRLSRPGRRAGRLFRPAPPARPKTRSPRACRARAEPDARRPRRSP